MHRRDLLRLLPALGVACVPEPPMPTPSSPTSARSPVLFVAHGAPPLLDDAAWISELSQWGEALPRPTAILMISAHWEERPLTLGATRTVPLIHDFYGFPARYYQITYAAPGAPALAERVRGLLGASGLTTAEAPTRGLDHGAYIPLLCMYPNAEVPVLQISLPSLDPKQLSRSAAPSRRCATRAC